jgi:hypothetical protein
MVGCPQEASRTQALFWLAGEPKPVGEQAASDGEVGGRFAARLDVAAVDSDGRRAL